MIALLRQPHGFEGLGRDPRRTLWWVIFMPYLWRTLSRRPRELHIDENGGARRLATPHEPPVGRPPGCHGSMKSAGFFFGFCSFFLCGSPPDRDTTAPQARTRSRCGRGSTQTRGERRSGPRPDRGAICHDACRSRATWPSAETRTGRHPRDQATVRSGKPREAQRNPLIDVLRDRSRALSGGA